MVTAKYGYSSSKAFPFVVGCLSFKKPAGQPLCGDGSDSGPARAALISLASEEVLYHGRKALLIFSLDKVDERAV